MEEIFNRVEETAAFVFSIEILLGMILFALIFLSNQIRGHFGRIEAMLTPQWQEYRERQKHRDRT